MMMGWGYGMGFGMLIWWALVIGGLVLAFYGLSSLSKGKPTKKEMTRNAEPLDILKERFAKGEISEEEYEQKKQFLLK